MAGGRLHRASLHGESGRFVTPATRPGHDLRLRWLTPSGKEITFCGHATVATGHVLAETGRLTRDRVVFDTLGGTLPVAVAATAERVVVWLEPALPTCIPYPESLGPVLDALRVSAEGVGSWALPALTGERDLLILRDPRGPSHRFCPRCDPRLALAIRPSPG
ncbi:MAG: PhzF family phenazine biosynthesis protein [Candidatus Rokubacteria bacterium]|nr:PhzF family phenazine biosynthesis protein [Candidatus Rokubacteria bacterium]